MFGLKHKLFDTAGGEGGAAGGGDAGAAGGAAGGAGGAGAAGGAAGGAPAGPWYGSFKDEGLRGYAELKGWQDPAAAVESYRNLEKLQGVPADQLLRLPKAGDKDAYGKLYDRLGRPQSADGYELPVPEGDNGEFAKTVSPWLHEIGLSKEQGQALAAKWNEYQAKVVAEHTHAKNEAAKAGDAALKKEWGMAYDQNIIKAREGMVKLGIEPAMIDKLESVLGFADTIKFMHSIGTKIGEDNFVSSGGRSDFSGKLTPAGAQARITQLLNDPVYAKRYAEGGADEAAEMARLHEMAYPTLAE